MVTVEESIEELTNYETLMGEHGSRLNGMLAIAYAGLFDNDTYEFTGEPLSGWAQDRIKDLRDYIMQDMLSMEITVSDGNQLGEKERDRYGAELIDRYVGLKGVMAAFSQPSFSSFQQLSAQISQKMGAIALDNAKPERSEVTEEYITELTDYISALNALDSTTAEERSNLQKAQMIRQALP